MAAAAEPPVGLAVLADRGAARPDVAGEVAPIGLLEPPVELGQARHPWHRHEEASPLPTDLVLDAALLVGTPRAGLAEEAVEAIVAAQGDERIVVRGPELVGARLTPEVYSLGLALALPERVQPAPEWVLARPTGVGRAITAYDMPIEGGDEWLAAARRLA